MEIIESIPYSLWRKIAEWGKETDCLSINYQSAAQETAHKLKFNHKFTDSDRRKAINIYNIVCEKTSIYCLRQTNLLPKTIGHRAQFIPPLLIMITIISQ